LDLFHREALFTGLVTATCSLIMPLFQINHSQSFSKIYIHFI
jgi:hypothetical protein